MMIFDIPVSNITKLKGIIYRIECCVVKYKSEEYRGFALLLLRDIFIKNKIKKIYQRTEGLPVSLKFLISVANYTSGGIWVGAEPTQNMIELAKSILVQVYKKHPFLKEKIGA